MRVDPELARRAVEPLAKAMGKSIVETALGICKVAENNMGRAVGAVTSRRGLDPRQFTLLSFGGAGGLHACAIADGLEIKQVLVPPYAGVLSALGMVIAPPVADASRTVLQLRDQLDDPRLAAEFGALSGLTSDVIPLSESASVEAYADVRFTGQSHELTVKVDRPSRQQIESSFLDEYRARYGQTPAGRAVEIVTLRLRRLGKVAPLQLPALQEADAPSIDRGDLVLQEGSTVAVPRLTRETLTRSNVKEGPFLIIDSEATTFVAPGWSAAATPSAAILLSRKT
jgi:N-methylhydantoinase A